MTTANNSSVQMIDATDSISWRDLTFYSADHGEVSRGHAEWTDMIDELRETNALGGAYLTQAAFDAWSNPDLDPSDYDLDSSRIDWDGYEEYRDIASAVSSFGDFAYANKAEFDRVAQEWLGHDFTAAGVKTWLNAGAFTASAASALYEAGVTSEEAGERRDELEDRGNTIAYAVANGDLSVEKALKILGR